MTPAEVAAAYLGAFAGGDADRIAACVTDDFVNEHTATLGTASAGRAVYRQRLDGFLQMMVGVTYHVESLIAEDNEVAAAYVMRARFQGTQPFEVRGIQRLTIRDGLVARRVDYWDSLAFLLQVDPALRDPLSNWL